MTNKLTNRNDKNTDCCWNNIQNNLFHNNNSLDKKEIKKLKSREEQKSFPKFLKNVEYFILVFPKQIYAVNMCLLTKTISYTIAVI